MYCASHSRQSLMRFDGSTSAPAPTRPWRPSCSECSRWEASSLAHSPGRMALSPLASLRLCLLPNPTHMCGRWPTDSSRCKERGDSWSTSCHFAPLDCPPERSFPLGRDAGAEARRDRIPRCASSARPSPAGTRDVRAASDATAPTRRRAVVRPASPASRTMASPRQCRTAPPPRAQGARGDAACTHQPTRQHRRQRRTSSSRRRTARRCPRC